MSFDGEIDAIKSISPKHEVAICHWIFKNGEGHKNAHTEFDSCYKSEIWSPMG